MQHYTGKNSTWLLLCAVSMGAQGSLSHIHFASPTLSLLSVIRLLSYGLVALTYMEITVLPSKMIWSEEWGKNSIKKD